jgi:hypothetical protein
LSETKYGKWIYHHFKLCNFQGFSRKGRAICIVSYFINLIPIFWVFQERCLLLEKMMVFVLNNIYKCTSRHGKRGGNIFYPMVSEKMMTYGGNLWTLPRWWNLPIKHLKMYFYINGLILAERIPRAPRVYFHVEIPCYRSVDAFNKWRLLFLLILVVCIIYQCSVG